MSENIPEDKKDVKPKPDSSLSEDDINKLFALLKKKMQVITIITSGVTGFITSLVVLITYNTLQPPVIGSNGTLEPSHELSAPAWERNSSLVIFTTKDRTFSFDLESVSQGDSFVSFQKSLMNQFKEDLMDVNRTLSYLQVALTNISEHCDDKTGSLESALKGLTALNQSITGQNLRLDTLNITLLVVQNTSQLLKIDQLELLERLIENNATLHDVIEHLRNLDQSVEQHGQKANKAYDRSLLASAEMYSMGISASWILYSIVIGLLIELPITLFCMKWLLANRGPNPAVIPPGMDQAASVHHNRTSETVQKPEVKTDFLVLKDAVTLIGMDRRTLNSCKKLVTSLTKDMGIEVRNELVKEPVDLKNITWSKVMLLLVDNNERDVILEEPNLLQGQNKVKIAEAAISNGVDLFVIYVGHQESQHLSENNLFDPCLASVRKHPILKLLSANGRVMSIKQEFTKHQQKQLKKAFRNF